MPTIFEENNITTAKAAREYAIGQLQGRNYTEETFNNKVNSFMDAYYNYEDANRELKDMEQSMSKEQYDNVIGFAKMNKYDYSSQDKNNEKNVYSLLTKAPAHPGEIVVGYEPGSFNSYTQCESGLKGLKGIFYKLGSSFDDSKGYSDSRKINVGEKLLYPKIKELLKNMYANEGYDIDYD